MKYLFAYLQTLLTLLFAFVSPVFTQWYSIYFHIEHDNLFGIYALLVLIGILMLALTIIRWIAALTNQSIKEILK